MIQQVKFYDDSEVPEILFFLRDYPVIPNPLHNHHRNHPRNHHNYSHNHKIS
ncbi:hypothetical protein L873DRAFT_1801870 [Choiromyces venosus 120613-1]|uniref:Uncharacterized protein n=1 Tax=Choiromyces venosus 120613-1 TaxID=1336337 RepID=A0A3N4K307_9PEZI|nr:hypothetical protein L873DRAFT_1815047 [Choiromyces venosus 120613-1]RPB02801.1 hypothetical protein L873DRAFT_1801837 [Choiromyces venosus 120613-1]RPB02821.1 hypothetical protein L873DRAFT_1801870 [Choiromyces venosus 120613-1]